MSLAPLCAQSIRGVMCTARIRFGGVVIASASFGYSTTRTHADANAAQRSVLAGTKTSVTRSAVLALSPARLRATEVNIARAVDRILAYIVDIALCAVGYVANGALASLLGVSSGWGLAAFMPASILIFWYNGGATLGQRALGLRALCADRAGDLSSPSLLTSSFYVPGRALSPLYGLIDWPCVLLFTRGECLHNYITGMVVVDELHDRAPTL